MSIKKLENQLFELTKLVSALIPHVDFKSQNVVESCSQNICMNIENKIQSKNLNVAVLPPTQKEIQNEMPYLKNGGWVESKKRKGENRYRGGYMDNGKRIQVYGKTKQECADKVNCGVQTVIDRLKLGFDLPHKNMKLFTWLDEWFVGYEPSVSVGQAKVVKNNIRHIKINFRDAKLNDLNPFEIEKSLAKIISSRTGQPSTKIQKEAFDTLNMALREAKKKKLVKENPMENVTKTTHESENRLAFTEQVQKDILRYAKVYSAYYKYFLFGFNTGCRPDEFSKIKKCHINFNFKTVFIDGTKTKGSKRTMPLFTPLYELHDHLKNLDDNVEVFTANTDCLNDELRRILIAIGVENSVDYSLYSMRHTLHTRLNEQGIDANTIAKWLGNSPEIARKVYIKVMPEHEQRQAELYNAKVANF